MWTRKELKSKGKSSFKRNYWKALIVALLLSIIAGGTYSGFSGRNSYDTYHSVKNSDLNDGNHFDVSMNEDANGKYNLIFDVKDENGNSVDSEAIEEVEEITLSKNESIAAGITIAVCVFIISAIIGVIVAAIDAFLLNPIEMGCNKFFLKNLDEDAKISNVTYAFDNNYKNVVKVMFRRDLAIVLWSLLFVIPGIYKAYEYRMIPYLLAENPNMSWQEAFNASKEMMTGNKWKAFVLDLSFIGWHLLSILTLGLLSIFYVNPYKFATNAALYERLKYGDIDTTEVVTA